MLKIIGSMKEMNFSALMEVYSESNRENGDELFPSLPQGQRLLLAEQGFHQYLGECFFKTPGAVYCVWELEGKYVSALRLEPYGDGLLLEALETAPDCRKRGYAKALINAVLAYLGKGKVYSHVSKRNKASLAVHAACGFHVILDHAVYADGSVLQSSYTLKKEI